MTTAHPRTMFAGLSLATIALAILAATIVPLAIPFVLLPLLGALSLAEAAKLSENDLQRGVVETFILESGILDRAPLKQIEGNGYTYNEEATLPGVEFRAVNAAYAESTGTVNQKTETLVILGGDADVDTYIIRTRSNVNDQKAEQTTLKTKAAAYKLQDTFINGDITVDVNSFDGLKKRLTGGQVISFGTNGLAIIGADSNARHTFLDKIDELIAAVPGLNGDNGALYLNDLVKAKIMGSARREHIASTSIEDFGKTVDRYRGIPLVDVGFKADGSRIIPQTEVQGASSVASSIYAVKYGSGEADRAVTMLYNGPEAVFDVRDLGELQTKPSERVRIEGFVSMALFGGKAAARGTGALAS